MSTVRAKGGIAGMRRTSLLTAHVFRHYLALAFFAAAPAAAQQPASAPPTTLSAEIDTRIAASQPS
jgi:hypothetical protein